LNIGVALDLDGCRRSMSMALVGGLVLLLLWVIGLFTVAVVPLQRGWPDTFTTTGSTAPSARLLRIHKRQ